MGTLLLLRQVGASFALTLAASLYASGRQGGASAAAATGNAVCIVALAGVAVAAGALLSLPRGANRFAPVPVPALAHALLVLEVTPRAERRSRPRCGPGPSATRGVRTPTRWRNKTGVLRGVQIERN